MNRYPYSYILGFVEESISRMARSSRREAQPYYAALVDYFAQMISGDCLWEHVNLQQTIWTLHSQKVSFFLPAVCSNWIFWACNNFRVGHCARIYKVQHASSPSLCKNGQKGQEVVQHCDRCFYAVHLPESCLHHRVVFDLRADWGQEKRWCPKLSKKTANFEAERIHFLQVTSFPRSPRASRSELKG